MAKVLKVRIHRESLIADNNLIDLVLVSLLLKKTYDYDKQHSYINKKEINYTQIAKEIGIHRTTVAKQIGLLIQINIITELDDYYTISNPTTHYFDIPKTTLQELFNYKEEGLITLYTLFAGWFYSKKKTNTYYTFSIQSLAEELGHIEQGKTLGSRARGKLCHLLNILIQDQYISVAEKEIRYGKGFRKVLINVK